MSTTNCVIRNRKSTKTYKARVLFLLQQELLDQIREVAIANDVSVSHFLREAARRNINAYKKAAQ